MSGTLTMGNIAVPEFLTAPKEGQYSLFLYEGELYSIDYIGNIKFIGAGNTDIVLSAITQSQMDIIDAIQESEDNTLNAIQDTNDKIDELVVYTATTQLDIVEVVTHRPEKVYVYVYTKATTPSKVTDATFTTQHIYPEPIVVTINKTVQGIYSQKCGGHSLRSDYVRCTRCVDDMLAQIPNPSKQQIDKANCYKGGPTTYAEKQPYYPYKLNQCCRPKNWNYSTGKCK
jgi:hypothetical protein